MKKNKIIGIAVASLGVAASMSAAFALHVSGANDISFDFGASWTATDGAISYKVNGKSSGTVAPTYLKSSDAQTLQDETPEGLGGEYTQAHYAFTLGATYASNELAQNVVVGNFALSINNVNAALADKLVVWASVNGYEENSLGEQYYSSLMTKDSAVPTTGYSANWDIAVDCVGNQTVDVYVKLTEQIKGADLLALNEGKPFDISVTWGKPTTFKAANVVGNGNMWTDDESYEMVPNIHKTKEAGQESVAWEWMFDNLPGTMDEIKAKDKDGNWATGENASLDASKVYSVYWGGANTAVSVLAKE